VALHFLEAGLRAGERCLYLGFQEPPERLLAKAARVGIDLQQYVDSGLLEIKWHPSVDLLADALAHEVLDDVRGHATKRVVIDSLDGFRDSIMHGERTTRFLAAFTNELCVAGATTYLCDETRALFSPGVEVPTTNISAYVDNILFVRQVELDGELLRIVAVLKTRESARDPTLRVFTISQRGLRVEGPLRHAEAALTGTAHATDTQRASKKKKATKKKATKRRGSR
jgi:circadian clock protein KaiC